MSETVLWYGGHAFLVWPRGGGSRWKDPAVPRTQKGRNPGSSESRAIIRTREGLGRLERARTPGPDPAGEPSAATRGTRPTMTVETSTWATKKGLAQMLKGGVIMDVVTPDQAKIAEDAGAVAVMALERVPADIRAAGGVARMSDPEMIDGIMDAVTIPVMAKARIGHFVEAQVLEALGVDYIDESEVLTPADESNHIDKHAFKVPFVCGCRNLGEALRRINEGAAMIRTKGEAGTGNIVEAVRQLRDVLSEIRPLAGDARGRAVRRGQGAPGAVRAGQGCRRERQAAGRELRRRRHQHPGRCGARDAARRGGRLRRLGHLQERGPGPDGQRDRPGDDASSTTRRTSPRSPRASGAPMRGIALEEIPEEERLAVRGW